MLKILLLFVLFNFINFVYADMFGDYCQAPDFFSDNQNDCESNGGVWITNTVPNLVTAPQITSSVFVPGSTITTDHGTWTDNENDVLTYYYHWTLDDFSLGTNVELQYSTSNSYTIKESDVGKWLSVVVNVYDGGPQGNASFSYYLGQNYFEILSSSPTPTVTPMPTPTPTAIPTPTATPTATPTPTATATINEIVGNNPANATASQLEKINSDNAQQVTPEIISALPPESISGLSGEALGSLPSESIYSLSSQQLANINPDAFKQTGNDKDNNQQLGLFLVNLNPENITPEDAQTLLPEGWSINTNTGEIIPPVGTQITLPSLTTQKPSGFNLPDDVPDLSKSFSIGGEGGDSLLDKCNQALGSGLSDFQFTQDTSTGKLVFNNAAIDNLISLMPDAKGIKQVDASITPGASPNNAGFWVITTEDSQQITLRPSPKNPEQLGNTVNGGGEVYLGNQGDVLVAGQDKAFTALFALDVQQISTRASSGLQVQNDGTGLFVFENGVAQKVFPVPNNPDLLEHQLKSRISGIDNLLFKADGTMTGTYYGRNVIVETLFESDVTENQTGNDNSAGDVSFNKIESDGSLGLVYKSPVPLTDETKRARISNTDVQQRISIRFSANQGENTPLTCLEKHPDNFLDFIQKIARCKFILF